MNLKMFFFASMRGIYLTTQKDDLLLFETGELIIYSTKAAYQDKIVYDVKNDYRRITNAEEFEAFKCVEGIKVVYNPLSLAGNYNGYEKTLFDSGAEGDCYGNSSSEATVSTINTKSGKKTNLLEFVAEGSLVTTLKNDLWVRDMNGTMDTSELNSKVTIQEILTLINSNMGFGFKFKPDSFAFIRYPYKIAGG